MAGPNSPTPSVAGVQLVDASGVVDGTKTATIKPANTPATAADTAIVVDQSPNGPATYSVTTGAFAPAASATDIFALTGSGTKTVRVLRLIIEATQTTGGVQQLLVIKRSADDSGGTAVTDTFVNSDSNDASASAVARHYTANPAGLGATAAKYGTLRNEKLFVSAATAQEDRLVVDFAPNTNEKERGIVLRGTADVLCVNLAGVTWTGGSACITAEITEE